MTILLVALTAAILLLVLITLGLTELMIVGISSYVAATETFYCFEEHKLRLQKCVTVGCNITTRLHKTEDRLLWMGSRLGRPGFFVVSFLITLAVGNFLIAQQAMCDLKRFFSHCY